MKKIRFVIVGSGWRSLYYVRIAKALPEQFEMCAMYCRTREKAERMAAEYSITTTTSVEECISSQPDFVVVAVTKADIARVSIEWMNYGMTVLCETPAALELSVLEQLWKAHLNGKKLVVAEQYTRYPIYRAMRKLFDQNRMGSRDILNLSLAHEYHGASLMREFLKIENERKFRITAKMYEFQTIETMSRKERFTDGRSSGKKRTIATFEFEGGQVAIYDFDSEQYRSPIRKNTIKLQGLKGEWIDDTMYWLEGSTYEPRSASLEIKSRQVITESENPNLHRIEEIEEICFDGESLYKAEFGMCGLAQDETAIATLMKETAAYARGEAQEPEPLASALTDAYVAILMKEACETGKAVEGKTQVWM